MSPALDARTSFLIILLGSLGDVARGLALASSLKRNLAQSKITWLVEPACKDLVAIHPAIDEVLVFERGQGLRALADLYKTLRGKSFDLVLDLQRHLKSGIFSLMSGAKRRIGFNRSDAKEFNWLFNTEQIEAFGESISKLEHYLKFVDWLGLERTPIDFGLQSFPAKSYLPSELKVADLRYIALVLGSRWQSKDWPEDSYRKLIEKLIAGCELPIVLMGDRRQAQPALRLQSALPSDKLINLAGKTSLLQLMAVLKSALCCLGPDSGPGHLAAALGTPYVSLFGPTPVSRVVPYGAESLVLKSKLVCSPCSRKLCPGLDSLCMKLISPEAAYEKLMEVSNSAVILREKA